MRESYHGEILQRVGPVRYQYLLSLPERAVRSLSALSGGILKELGEVVVPARLRRTALYRSMVDITLRIMIREVGQVQGIYPDGQEAGHAAQNFLLQRSASHGIDALGLLTLHASPVWVLAALADATGVGHSLIVQISQALKDDGLLDPDDRFETLDQMLDGLERTSAQLALTLSMPPVSLEAMRTEWRKLKVAMQTMPHDVPEIEQIEVLWRKLQRLARVQNRSVFALSSLIALSAISHVPGNLLWLSRASLSAARRTGQIFGNSILNHYKMALIEIEREGFFRYWSQEFQPYLRGAAEQFAPGRESLTERLLKPNSRKTDATSIREEAE